MPGANRHRPPTSRQYLARIYRRQIETGAVIRELKAEIERRGEITTVVVEHCRRLLLEKETLLKIIEANQFMAQELPRRPAVRTLYDGFGMPHMISSYATAHKESEA